VAQEEIEDGVVPPRVEAEAAPAPEAKSAPAPGVETRDGAAEEDLRGLPVDDEGKPVAIRVRDLVVGFGEKLIMDGLSLDVRAGEVLGFVGASGVGKSVLTRTILGLVKKRAGSIEVLGQPLDELDRDQRREIEKRWGVLFQQGALFSALTVKQNIQAPMREYLDISESLMDELAMLKIALVGLKPDAADKYPSELSGGMIKRAALARALALDPEIVFLDEPTAGLDPIGAGEFDALIATLQKTLGLTVFMVTHDLDSLYAICDRVAALGDRKVIAVGPIEKLAENPHPWLQAYFHGERGARLHGAYVAGMQGKASE
jgi:phospholipid/cholesterol/gamma-HCH transport system ATP-binding protein